MKTMFLKNSRKLLYFCALMMALPFGQAWSREIEEEDFFKPCVFPSSSHSSSESGERVAVEFFKDDHYAMDDQAEAILRRLKEGKDGREPKDPREFPYKAQVHFKTTFSIGKGEVGSGTFIDEHVVLTAAHVVYSHDKGGLYKSLECFIDPHRLRPAGKVEGVKIAKDYLDNPEQNWESDYALVFLDRATGRETGHLGLRVLSSDESSKISVTIVGYPLDKIDRKSGAISLWGMSGRLEKITPHSLHYNIDTFSGQSGSAIWYHTPEKGYCVVGVHAYAPDKDYSYNRGPRLIKPMSSNLSLWLKEFKQWSSNSSRKKEEFFDNQGLWVQSFKILDKKEGMAFESANLSTEELGDEGISVDLLSHAKNGDTNKQYEIGLKYNKGEPGLSKDEIRSLYWFRQAFNGYESAALKGDAEAQNKLGVMYSLGRVVEKNLEQSRTWYQKAADQGHPKALYNLGSLYENGNGVKKNMKAAAELYKSAADKGEANAQYRLGEFYK